MKLEERFNSQQARFYEFCLLIVWGIFCKSLICWDFLELELFARGGLIIAAIDNTSIINQQLVPMSETNPAHLLFNEDAISTESTPTYGMKAPVPKSPGRRSLLLDQQTSPKKSQNANPTSSSTRLMVHKDTHLKSCLSLNSDLGDNTPSLSNQVQHPSFVVHDDIISPNKHGLLGLNLKRVVTPAHDEEFAHSHLALVSAMMETTNTNSSVSSISSPPFLFAERSPQHGIDPVLLSNEVFESPTTGPASSSASSPGTNFSPTMGSNSILGTLERNKSPISLEEKIEKECQKLHLLIGVTGCLAARKNVFLLIEKLYELYTHEKLEIQIVLTETAEFILKEKISKFESLGVKIWYFNDSIKYFQKSKAKVRKQELARGVDAPPREPPKFISSSLLTQYSLAYNLQRWTDVLLLAPLSANMMSKLINGLSDDLLTEVLHLWPVPLPPAQGVPRLTSPKDMTVISNDQLLPKPIIAALALTGAMYSHPITKRQLIQLQETYPNMSILKPVEKYVDVDGKITMGGMRAWREVVEFVMQKLGPPVENEDDDDDDDDENEEDDEEEEEDNNEDDNSKSEIELDEEAEGEYHDDDDDVLGKEDVSRS